MLNAANGSREMKTIMVLVVWRFLIKRFQWSTDIIKVQLREMQKEDADTCTVKL